MIELLFIFLRLIQSARKQNKKDMERSQFYVREFGQNHKVTDDKGF